MAIRYAVANGNWSNTATWNGGTLPTSADDVYANNFTVTVNQNINVISLRNGATTGVTAGGNFTINGGYTIVADTIVSNLVVTTGSLVTITANSITSNSGNVFSSTNFAINYVINGNLTASNSQAISINNGQNSSITLNGNFFAGSTASATMLGGSNTITIIVNGIVQSSTAASGVIYSTINSIVRIQKAFSPDNGLPVVTQSNRQTTTIVKEIEQGNFGQFPISGYVRFDNAISIVAKVLKENNTQINLVDASNLPNELPAESNVRFGIGYNNGNKVGTAYIPAAASVGFGVPVDNTTGTAALTPASVWDAATSSLTTSGSIGERLKNASTVDTTGDQLAALL
jgi:hypothetical protein